MKVLSIHNYYKVRGGEEESYELEAKILRENGHQVDLYQDHNSRLHGLSLANAALKTVWSKEAFHAVGQRLTQEKYDIVHVHNFFPLISPSVYYAASHAKVPVVQTLQNFRLLCPNALFLREEKVCEDCLGKLIPYPSVIHNCYRDSKAASFAAASMLAMHRVFGTWKNKVDAYIALSNYDRNKFIEGGLPAEKIAIKPNIVYPDPGIGRGSGGYALFVGRLSVEKGIDTLLTAWKHLQNKIPLKIIGDGPLSKMVEEAAQNIEGVDYLGRKPLPEVYESMGEASFVVYSSIWNETFSRVAVESFAKGTPVIASAGVEAMSELVDPGRTGLHFRLGNAEDLVTQVNWLLEHPEQLIEMRKQARAEFEAKYAAKANYNNLIAVYEKAIRTAAMKRNRSRLWDTVVPDSDKSPNSTPMEMEASYRYLDR